MVYRCPTASGYQNATVRWNGREGGGRRRWWCSSRAVIRRIIHCEELSDGDSRDTMGVVVPVAAPGSTLTLSAESCGTKPAQLQMDDIVNESSLVPRTRRKPSEEDRPMVRVVGNIDGRSTVVEFVPPSRQAAVSSLNRTPRNVLQRLPLVSIRVRVLLGSLSFLLPRRLSTNAYQRSTAETPREHYLIAKCGH